MKVLSWVLLLAVPACAACQSDDDDAAADDDAADNDDTADDDLADDDTAEGKICLDTGAMLSLDPCQSGPAATYCLGHTPLIVDGERLTQFEAENLCQQEPDDLWRDVHECYRLHQPLAKCLSQRGWPADYPAVFDPTAWLPEEWAVNEVYGALNLFYYDVDHDRDSCNRQVSGGIVDPAAPLLHLGLTGFCSGSLYYVVEYSKGRSVDYSATEIDFSLTMNIWNCLMFDCSLTVYDDQIWSFFPAEE